MSFGIFVWTLNDVVGVTIAVIIAGFVIAMLAWAIVDIYIIQPIKRWFRGRKK